MKIVLSSNCSFWNLDMPVIQKHLHDVIYVKYTWDVEREEQIVPNQFNIEEYICCGAPNPGYDSGDYRETVKAVDDFERMLEKGEDIVFLCDTSLSSMYLFRAMADKASDYNIHLVFIHMNIGDMHNYFFGNRIGDRRQMQNKLLFVKDLKSVVSIKEGQENGLDTTAFLETVINQIAAMRNGATYVFDHEKKGYVEKKIVMLAIDASEKNVHSDFKEIMLAGVPVIHYEKEDESVTDATRSDGKLVCKVLKKMRRQIIEANGLDVEVEDCDYEGECAGTCPKCELEVSQVEAQMTNIPEEDRVYPQFDIDEEMEKAREEF